MGPLHSILTPRRRIAALIALWPGVLAAAVTALAASFLSEHYGGPALLLALLLGMALYFVGEQGRCAPGAAFAAGGLTRAAVALMGARISVEQIVAVGPGTLLVVVAGVASCIGGGWLASRALGLGGRFGLLTGGAVGICGASAAMALSQALPPGRDRESDERDTAFTVVGVTTLSTLAMIAYPPLAGLLGLDQTDAGRFLGATIHDVAQVVAAGYSLSDEAGDSATVVKLMRVALLAPVVAIIALAARRARGASATTAGRSWPLPPFIIGFILLAGANSLGLIAPPAAETAGAASRALLLTAIAALGMRTSLGALARLGVRPVLLLAGQTLFLAGLVLGLMAAGL
jgi:uncharacterized integral membrane protein (TIGR00698 family)